MSKVLFYKRMDKYLVINLNYFHLNACNLFSICYLCFIGSGQASLKRNSKMCLRQLVLNVKIDRLNEIEKHLDWADNYGLSDDDQDGWEHCKQLEKEKQGLLVEIKSLEKYINY